MNMLSYLFSTRNKKEHVIGRCLVILAAPLIVAGCGGGVTGGSPTDPNGGTLSATLTWDSPTTYEDGSCLTDIAGYTIHYGSTSGNYQSQKSLTTNELSCVDSGTTTSCGQVKSCSVTISNISPGHWYFSVSAFNDSGVSSGLSNEANNTYN